MPGNASIIAGTTKSLSGGTGTSRLLPIDASRSAPDPPHPRRSSQMRPDRIIRPVKLDPRKRALVALAPERQSASSVVLPYPAGAETSTAAVCLAAIGPRPDRGGRRSRVVTAAPTACSRRSAGTPPPAWQTMCERSRVAPPDESTSTVKANRVYVPNPPQNSSHRD
jgi:hypothetical protein